MPKLKPSGPEFERGVPEIPDGITRLRTLEGRGGYIASLVITTDGRSVIAAYQSGDLEVWDLLKGTSILSLDRHSHHVNSLAVTPDGQFMIAACKDGVWGLPLVSHATAFRVYAEKVNSVAVTPDGRTIVAGVDNGEVAAWDVESKVRLRAFEGASGFVYSVAVSPDGSSVIAGGADRTVRVWDLKSGRILHVLNGHTGSVTSVAATPDGLWLVSTSEDHTVRVWDRASGRLVRTLEGHTRVVAGIAIAGHFAATASAEHLVRLWGVANGICFARLPAGGPLGPTGTPVAFSLGGRNLLTVAGPERRGAIQVWDVDFSRLLGGALPSGDVHYRNAKVVLVGDSGVGKSGLGMVLAGQQFEPTPSTHGRRVWLFHKNSVSQVDGVTQTREVLLWDLAGQPGYRIVHQLNIDQAAVALVVVDARSESDPLGPAEYWARAIAQAQSAVPIIKFLVVARVDRGGLAINKEGIGQFAERFGFARVFQTSAKTGEGVPALAQAIREAIRWDDLEEVTSTLLFTAIKEFIQKEKERGDQALVEKLDGLFERFKSVSEKSILRRWRMGSRKVRQTTPADFRTCVMRLEAVGLVEVLVFTALDKTSGEKTEYVLLQPEYVDAYASAAVMTARDDPRGIGHVLESELLDGRFRLEKAERIPDPKVEQWVLAVTIERLLKHDIALRERMDDGDYLVFPSEYTRSAPYPRRNAPGVAFDFQGAIRAIFTTLVVRLAHHRDFTKADFYRDAACYDTVAGGRCAVVLDETAPGQGRMSVYFEDSPSDVEQRAFLRFVRKHLESKAKPESIQLHRLYYCRACGNPFSETVIQTRLTQAKRDIICPACEERSLLFDLLMLDDAQAQDDAGQMFADANAARRRQLATTAIEGKKRIGEYDVFLSYNTKDRDRVVAIAESLVALGIRPWLDVWDLVPGRPWQDGLNAALVHVKAAAVCVGPVGTGPWQDQEILAFIRKFVSRSAPVIPVLLPGAKTEPNLPPLLESFLWVDMREFGPANSRPLANLVAGILGKRPGEMEPENLAEQVSAILESSRSQVAPVDAGQQIVLPVQLQQLDETELQAVRQQLARLLGIRSEHLKLVGTKPGSVKIVLVVDDLNAVSQLFAMVHRGDAALRAYFVKCQIDAEKFTEENMQTAQAVKQEVEARKIEAADADTPVSLDSVPREELSRWTGPAKVMNLALVFTDIVDSTKLCNDLTDAVWDGIRQQHFTRAVTLVREQSGFVVKNTGDGILALFHNAIDAVEFAVTLHRSTGNAVVRIRAGVHVGQVSIDGGDTFGRNVNLAARVMSHARADGVMVSERVRQDVDERGDPRMSNLQWTAVPDVVLKGFEKPVTLWAVGN